MESALIVSPSPLRTLNQPGIWSKLLYIFLQLIIYWLTAALLPYQEDLELQPTFIFPTSEVPIVARIVHHHTE